MWKLEIFVFVLVMSTKTANCAMEGRVVGGDFARIEDFPHSAFLNVGCSDTMIVCGASVLNQRLLLTAAHCVYECRLGEEDGHGIQAYLGQSDISKIEINRVVTDIIIHEKYVDHTVENDIAIVMVEGVIPFSKGVKRVILAKYWPTYEDDAYVAGWGIYDLNSPYVFSMKLRSARQKLRPLKSCESLHLSAGMFCAGTVDPSVPHAATGDSGSALVVKDIHQIGIVSFSVESHPGLMVYANVTYYYKWIVNNSDKLFCRSERK